MTAQTPVPRSYGAGRGPRESVAGAAGAQPRRTAANRTEPPQCCVATVNVPARRVGDVVSSWAPRKPLPRTRSWVRTTRATAPALGRSNVLAEPGIRAGRADGASDPIDLESSDPEVARHPEAHVAVTGGVPTGTRPLGVDATGHERPGGRPASDVERVSRAVRRSCDRPARAAVTRRTTGRARRAATDPAGRPGCPHAASTAGDGQSRARARTGRRGHDHRGGASGSHHDLLRGRGGLDRNVGHEGRDLSDQRVAVHVVDEERDLEAGELAGHLCADVAVGVVTLDARGVGGVHRQVHLGELIRGSHPWGSAARGPS